MTALLERVPIDRITVEAREVDFRRTVLSAIAALLFGIGWLAAKTVGVMVGLLKVVWLGLCWAGVAVKLGWVDARKPKAAERGSA